VPFARVHDVVVFGKSLNPQFKVIAHSYYARRKEDARRFFEQQFPDNPVVKVIDLGVVEVEFSKEKYDALYENT